MQSQFHRKSWWLALVSALGGVAASGYLTSLHFKILKLGFAGQTLCNINTYINCDNVLMSHFASLGTLPLAGLGLVFYLYLVGALIWARTEPTASARTLTLPYLLIIFSVLISGVLAYLSFAVIHSLCIFCSTLYLINLLLLIFIKRVIGMSWGDWFRNFSQVSWWKAISYFVVVFAVGGILLHTGHKTYAKEIPQDKLDLYLAAYFKQPAVQIDTSGRPYFGNPDAKITVVEFSDFECPYCKRAANVIKPILRDYQDQVKFVFMNYPLDTTCNKAMERSLHKRACVTAFAAYCAGQQGKFWEYHDMAFKRQPKFHQASLENMAEKLKLDLNAFKDCLNSEAAKQAIEADLAQGVSAKIAGTPTVYVNGRKFAPWMSRKAWKQLIEKINQ